MKPGATMWDHFGFFAGAAAQEVVEGCEWAKAIPSGFSNLLPGISCAGPLSEEYDGEEELVEFGGLLEAREPLFSQTYVNGAKDLLSDDEDEETTEVSASSANPRTKVILQQECAVTRSQPKRGVSNLRSFSPEKQPEPEDLVSFSPPAKAAADPLQPQPFESNAEGPTEPQDLLDFHALPDTTVVDDHLGLDPPVVAAASPVVLAKSVKREVAGYPEPLISLEKEASVAPSPLLIAGA